MSRDSVIWNILFTVGGVLSVALAPVTNPAEYGLTIVALNWIKLGAAAMLAAGKFGNSPLRGENE